MSFISIRAVFRVMVATIATAAAATAPDIHALAQAVDNKYNHLHTLEAQFTEIYRGAGVDRTESGILWLKKPGKMRWEYRSPREKLFLSDGKDAWFYVPEDRRVQKTSIRELDDLRSPIGFLLGKTRLEKELQGLSFAPDVPPLQPENVVIRGIPKVLRERVSQVLLEITPGRQIARIVIQEVDGGVTEYRFSGQKEEVELTDARFRFVPPPGTEVTQGAFEP